MFKTSSPFSLYNLNKTFAEVILTKEYLKL